jgi:CRISPR-associated protein Csm1
MHQNVALAKQQRYTELGDELYTLVFQPRKHGGNEDQTCSVCGQEREGTTLLDQEDRICPLCNSFAKDFGGKLPHNKFIALYFGEPQRDGQGSGLDVLRAFGMDIEWLQDAESTPHSSTGGVIWTLDDVDSWPEHVSIPIAEWVHYTVRRTPSKTFDELQEDAQGIKRLGVLRMDVDNLGDMFIQGFRIGERDISTLGRLSTLSFQLSLFFEGWVKKLCQEGEREGKIYAVYAGGDDVFLIGPWDLVPELAHQIQTDFQRFAAYHPKAHLSAGMTFIHGKYPVYQAADDAEIALNAAKELEGKNAFTFLGQPWKWHDFETVKSNFQVINHLVENTEQGGPNSIIQILRQLAAEQDQTNRQKDAKPLYGPWLWRGVYMLKRMEERYKNKESLSQQIEEIRTNLDANDFGDLDQWAVAARWSQLIHREAKKGE